MSLDLQIAKLMPKVRDKILHMPVAPNKVSFQYLQPNAGDVDYYPLDRELNNQDLISHFKQEVVDTHYKGNPCKRGSLAVRPLFKNERVKFFCMDIDFRPQMKLVRKKFLPLLKKLKIDYIFEYGGTGGNKYKAHIWFFTNTNKSLHRAFVDVLLDMAGMKEKFKKMKFEIFPAYKANNVIRLPGGPHLRYLLPDRYDPDTTPKNLTNGIKFRGIIGNDPIFIMQSILDCKIVTNERMAEIIEGYLPHVKASATLNDPLGILAKVEYAFSSEQKKLEGFHYRPRKDLTLPKELYRLRDWKGRIIPMPKFIETVGTQCQAWHRVMHWTVMNEWLDERGSDIHNGGLFTHGMMKYSGEKTRKVDQHEEDFKDEYSGKYRFREHEGHKWEGADARSPRCDTMHDNFDQCGGCPFRGQPGFQNPSQLYWGKQVVEEVTDKVVLSASSETIRDDAFVAAEKLIYEAISNNDTLGIAISSGQGTQKSTQLDRVAVELAAKGHRSIIAVPRGDLSMEHLERIKQFGGDAFVVLSHKNLFKVFNTPFSCPSEKDIQSRIGLGVSTSAIKGRFCKGCKFEDVCPYPDQYKNVSETDKKIVIIQHAHFQSDDAMRKIMKQPFKAIFIDETFIKNIRRYLRPSKIELEVLSTYKREMNWISDILDWFKRGGRKRQKDSRLNPSEGDLNRVRGKINYNAAPWNLPDYIRAYNNGDDFDNRTGLFKYSPPPSADEIPILVLTDATLPFGLTKQVLNRPDLKRIGHERLINVKMYNPRNQIIKVVDGSASISALADDRYLNKWLRFIAHMAATEYKDLTILVTAYLPQVAAIREWFDSYYPELSSRITVAHMAVGVNTWANINVQFLLAGVHYIARDYYKEAWELRNIINYWNVIDDRELIPNTFPDIYKSDSPSLPDMTFQAVSFKLRLDKTTKRLVRFPQFKVARPAFEFFRQIEMLALGASQQAMRIRFFDDNIKIIWDIDRRYKPSILYTDYKLTSEVFGTLDDLELDLEDFGE